LGRGIKRHFKTKTNNPNQSPDGNQNWGGVRGGGREGPYVNMKEGGKTAITKSR